LNAARELLPDATNEELSAAGLLQLVSDNELAIDALALQLVRLVRFFRKHGLSG